MLQILVNRWIICLLKICQSIHVKTGGKSLIILYGYVKTFRCPGGYLCPTKKSPIPIKEQGIFYKKRIRRRPTLPPSRPGSTIGAEELNFRVRNGNGCDLLAIATEKSIISKNLDGINQ